MSPEWKDLVRNKIEAYNLYQAEDSLVLFIEKARLKDNWFDIELCIHDFELLLLILFLISLIYTDIFFR